MKTPDFRAGSETLLRSSPSEEGCDHGCSSRWQQIPNLSRGSRSIFSGTVGHRSNRRPGGVQDGQPTGRNRPTASDSPGRGRVELGVEQYLVRRVSFAGRAWHPWMTAIFSVTQQAVIANLPFWTDPPTDDFLWWIFWRAERRRQDRQPRTARPSCSFGMTPSGIPSSRGSTPRHHRRPEGQDGGGREALFEAGKEFYGPRSAEP